MKFRSSHHRSTFWLVFIILATGANLHGQWTDGTNVIYTTVAADKVGIGINTPDDLLHIKATAADAIFKIENTGDGNYSTLEFSRERLSGENVTGAVIYLESNTGSNDATLNIDVNTSTSGGSTDGARLEMKRLSSVGVNQINMLNANVGIGTDSPTDKLHVYGGDFRVTATDAGGADIYAVGNDGKGVDMYAQNGNGYLKTDTDGMDLILGGGFWGGTGSTSNSSRFVLKPDGKIGIGTASPAAKFHIANSYSAAPTGGFDASAWSIISNTSGSAGLALYSGSSSSSFIDFSDTDDANVGRMIYNHASNYMAFTTSAGERMRITSSGNVGIGTTTPTEELEVNGTIKTKVIEITGGADLAEPFDIIDPAKVSPGMVVSIDPENIGKLSLSNEEYDRKVAGIVSGAGGVNAGITMAQEGSIADGNLPVALSGRVYAWADASNGPIIPGDLLTTSRNPGHIMKVTDYTLAQGAIIGKAMSPLETGKGLVLVLVSLQ